MRYISIALMISVLGCLPVQAELSAKNIEKMVQDIKAKRSSKLGEDTNITSPFIRVKQETNSTVKTLASAKPVKASFVLSAIVNSTAFIDGSWRKVGDLVGEFHLENVADNHVVLKRGNRTITLFFKQAKPILKTSKE